MAEPLTAVELAELEASIDHLSGPDAWDEDRLESALIPVTHYVPRLLAERDALAKRVAERASDAAEEAAARVRVRAWLDEWSLKVQSNLVVTGCGRSAPDGCTELTAPDIDALLDGRDALAKRVAELEAAPQPIAIATDFRDVSDADVRKWREAVNAAAGKPLFVLEPSPDEKQAQAERDADVRAVVRAIQEIAAATNCYPRAVEDAIGALNKHFASRIAALDARTTGGGAT